MKKNYIVPVTNTIVIEAQAILAGSVKLDGDNVQSVSVSDDNYGGDASGILSRRQGGWDD